MEINRSDAHHRNIHRIDSPVPRHSFIDRVRQWFKKTDSTPPPKTIRDAVLSREDSLLPLCVDIHTLLREEAMYQQDPERMRMMFAYADELYKQAKIVADMMNNDHDKRSAAAIRAWDTRDARY